MKLKVRQEAIEGWKVEWDTHTDKHDHITNTARTLINNTKATWTTKTVTIWNPSLRRHSIPVRQKTLEGMAYVFSENNKYKGRQTHIQWQQHAADLIDAKRPETSLPQTTQTLAARMIDATTHMFATDLPTGNKPLKHTHAEDKDPCWNYKHMTHADINTSNYYYAPSQSKTERRALFKAHTDKRTGRTPKSLGFVELSPENKALITKLKLSHVATIPKGSMTMHTDRTTAKPTKNKTDIAVILAVSNDTQSKDHTEVLSAARVLTDWKEKKCPAADIHYTRLITELSGEASGITYNERSWEQTVHDTWNWIDSPEAYAGLPSRSQAASILKLRG